MSGRKTLLTLFGLVVITALVLLGHVPGETAVWPIVALITGGGATVAWEDRMRLARGREVVRPDPEPEFTP